MKNIRWKHILMSILIISCLLIISLLVRAYFEGKFNSVESLQEYVKGFGIFGPIVLIIIQAMQVIIPILPGFLGCAVGAVLYGPAVGFLCNYIGISLGSIIAFWLAKKYGIAIVKSMFSEKQFDKYSNWAGNSKSYTAFLFAGMSMPLFPDDFFCYFSGLTSMTLKKFSLIIIIGKPWCLLAYSIIFSLI